MAIGLVGKKCGMTRVFTETGASIPVTVVEVDANRITQVKNTDVDGYQAIQVTTGTRRDSRVTAAQKVTSRKLALKLVVVFGNFVSTIAILKVVRLAVRF
ncbi:hypothetical protein PKHYL_32340 [Psychrobacter sp. KH172YL61]|nr:hypothetical protein PKHYL_32340 [Psychrobacter sp. KH172YL61]